jgi:hypothetical protein
MTGRVMAQLELAARQRQREAKADAETRCMPSFFAKYDWRPIESAPFYEDVELFVTDFCGSFYGLRRACRLTSDGWVSSEGGKPLNVMPVQWKPVG